MTHQQLAPASRGEHASNGAPGFHAGAEHQSFRRARGLLLLSISVLLLGGLLITLPILLKPSRLFTGHGHAMTKFSTQH